MKKYLTFVLLAALLAALPFFSTHAVLGLDTYFHLARIEGIAQGLASGDFPVRVHPYQLNGYGDPVGLFYPDLFLYLPALLRLAGLPVQVASNLYGILIHLLTGALAFLAFSQLLRSARGGAIAAVFYLGTLYRLTVAYPRTALGELTAMAFLPLALAALYGLLRRGDVRRWPLLVIGATGVLASHIITGLLLTLASLVLLITSLPRLKERAIRLALSKAVLFTILLNAWFYAPFLWAMKHIPIHQTAVFAISLHDTALSLSNLWTLQGLVGFSTLLVLLAGGVSFLYRKKTTADGRGLRKRDLCLPLLALLLLLATTRLFPWSAVEHIPLLGRLLAAMQSPLRLASLLTIATSLLAARSICALRKNTASIHLRRLLLLLPLLCLLLNLASLKDLPMTFTNGKQTLAVDWSIRHDTLPKEERTGARILDHQDRTYLDYLPPAIKETHPAFSPDPAQGVVEGSFTRHGTHLSFEATGEGQWITLPLHALPGWEAVASGGSATTVSQLLETRSSPDGLLEIHPIPYGRQHIDIHYLGRDWFHSIDLLSLFSLLLFLLLMPQHLPSPLLKKLPAESSPFYPCLLVLCTLLVSLPLFSHHIFLGHDIMFHLARIEGIADSLAGGQFPVRLQGFQLAGYGYPAGYFYPDLLLYPAALLRLIGTPLGLTYNLTCLLVNLLTAGLTALAFTRLTGSRRSGCIASAVYTLTLYRLIDLYSRAAIGEAAALAFLPLTLVSLHLLLHRPQETRRHAAGLILGATGVLSSHILSTVMLAGTALLLLLYALPSLCHRSHQEKKTILKGLCGATLITILLNLWFYAPFYSMYHRIPFHMKDIASAGIGTYHLGMSAFHLAALRTLQGLLGWPALLLLAAALLLALTRWIRRESPLLPSCTHRQELILIALPCLALIASSDLFPWKAIQSLPLLIHANVLQFPYRLLALGIVPLALILGGVLEHLAGRSRTPCLLLVLCLLLLAASDTVLLSQMKTKAPNQIFQSLTIDFGCHKDRLPDTTGRGVLAGRDWMFLDYAYPDIDYAALISKNPTTIDDLEKSRTLLPKDIGTDTSAAKTNITKKRGTTLIFTSESETPYTATLPLFTYPNYRITDETGTPLPHGEGSLRRLTVQIPAGSHTITCRYEEPAPYRHAGLISLITLALLLLWYRRSKSA